MNKKLIILIALSVLIAGSFCFAAQLTFQQVAKDNQEMRKNIAWLNEGLLNMQKDSKLALTKAQKQKILPIYQALIQQRLVVLERDPNGNQHRQSNNNGSTQGPPDINDPQVQARLNKMQTATAFGNSQTDAIDKILTREQLCFIDNMNFNPDKYGFIDLGKLFGGSGQRQGQRPDQATIQAIRTKMQAGQDLLIQLNNQVMKMLNS